MRNKIVIMYCQTLHACYLLNRSSMAKARFTVVNERDFLCFYFLLLQVTFNTHVFMQEINKWTQAGICATFRESNDLWFDSCVHLIKLSFKFASLFFRRPITFAVFTPPRPTSPAHDGLYVAGSEETRRHELLESGRICLFGDGHGTRAAHV